jgi:LysM repeat protein
MFNFCCFGNKNKKGVKSIEIYNKDYKMLKGHTLPGLNKANLTKKEEIFQGNHVLASTPVSTKSFNSK